MKADRAVAPFSCMHTELGRLGLAELMVLSRLSTHYRFCGQTVLVLGRKKVKVLAFLMDVSKSR